MRVPVRLPNIQVVKVKLTSKDDEVTSDDDARHGSEKYSPAGDGATMRKYDNNLAPPGLAHLHDES